MSKSGKPMNTKNCICDKCGAEAHTVQGSQHRRCSGGSKEPRDKDKKMPSCERGTWQ